MSIAAQGNFFQRLILGNKFLFLTVGIFILAIPGLLFFGKIIDLGQSQLKLSADQVNVQSGNFIQTAKAQEVPKKPAIEDLGKAIPVFGANAVLAMDYQTDRILYAKNIHDQLSPASTTKLMTGLVSIDHYNLGDTLRVYSEDIVGGSSMGLGVGETLTYRGLLYGMLLNSGNDAAFTIASNYPGGLPAFVAAMNQKVKDLGLTDTSFSNPAGFDGANQYSSAFDLAKIAKAAVEKDELAKIVATKNTSVTDLSQDKEHDLKNLNQLLNEPGVIGIKTGTTEKSGENLVGLVDRNNHKVITVVLGSKDRFGETKDLMNWVYDNFVWN